MYVCQYQMKILVLTYGTRGDVQPFVALCKELKKAGHFVTLATAARFEAMATAHDVKFAPLNDELLGIIDTQQGREAMEGAIGFWGMLKVNFKLMRRVKPLQIELAQNCWDVAQANRPDAIVFHPKAFAAYAVSEELHVPLVMALLVPMLLPTRNIPHLGFPDLKVGKWYNTLTHYAVQQLMRLPARGILNAWRLRHGLGKQSLKLFVDGTGAHIPVVAGFSGSVVPRPDDWPKNSFLSGFWFLESRNSEALSADVEAFLQEGEPPVCFGFGSMAGSDPDRLRQIILEALTETGQRGLILSGWGGISAGTPRDGLLEVDAAPHDLLLPRVSMLVHHGGAGTTAAALRAGTPQLVVPFMGDQPFWGQRMMELGVAPAPIRQKHLTAENLTQAIHSVMQGQLLRTTATKLSEEIRSENGAHRAASFIDTVLSNRSGLQQFENEG